MTFKSKKNRVYLQGSNIKKVHQTAIGARLEADRLIYLHAQGLAVPKFLGIEGNTITMEYIPAAPIPDLIDEWEDRPNPAAQDLAMRGIVSWLAEYYIVIPSGQSRGDINGRNFLFDGQKIWGVDFEYDAYDTIESDIGNLLAFILTYNPAHTALKQSLATAIVHQAAMSLALDPQTILTQQALAIDRLHSNRKKRELMINMP